MVRLLLGWDSWWLHVEIARLRTQARGLAGNEGEGKLFILLSLLKVEKFVRLENVGISEEEKNKVRGWK